MAITKKQRRQRKIKRIRSTIAEQGKVRLTVHRTPRHIYAQLFSPQGQTLVTASTLEKQVREQTSNNGGNIAAAAIVGSLIGERAKQASITECAFDRSGFRYHGRIRALADAARSAGLHF